MSKDTMPADSSEGPGSGERQAGTDMRTEGSDRAGDREVAGQGAEMQAPVTDAPEQDGLSPEVRDAQPVPDQQPSEEPFDDLRPPRTHVSFETARDVEVGGQNVLQDVLSAGQVDYYRFRAEHAGFYEVMTDRHKYAPNLVVSLFDAERALLAQNDEGGMWPGDGIDSRLVVRLSEAGDFFVRVEDPSTPPQFFDGPFPLLYYHMSVRELKGGVPGVAIADGERPVRAVPLMDGETDLAYVTLLGEFNVETDVFELHGFDGRLLVGEALASGVEGNGSTAFGGGIRVVEAQSHLLAEIDRALGQVFVAPPVSDERIRVEVVGPTDLGDNPFYAVNLVLAPDIPGEQDDAANDGLAGAQPLGLMAMGRRRGVVRLTLPAGDVDHISFVAHEGEFVDVDCEGESAGSGVRGLSAEVLDGAEQVLGDGSETTLEQLRIVRAPVEESGEHFLRLSSNTLEDAQAAEPWLRCSVTIGP